MKSENHVKWSFIYLTDVIRTTNATRSALSLNEVTLIVVEDAVRDLANYGKEKEKEKKIV